MLTLRWMAVVSLTVVSSACTQAVENPAVTSENPVTKDEAQQMGGKADDGRDLCAAWGWYGDDECDTFCSLTDPDCLEPVCPDSSDPSVHYISDSDQDPEICTRILFTCEDNQTLFSDGLGCGCGCIDNDEPTQCPDPNDPTVHYIGSSHEDPTICYAIRFSCEQGQTPFTDACGCGCIDENEPTCPDPNDPTVHYIAESDENPSTCLAILFACEDWQTPFTNECGCGCIDTNEPVCPDPSDPTVHYVAGSDENPSACHAIRFTCEEGQTPFSDECGCGCIDTSCPDPNDPNVHYVGNSHENPAECLPILFGCEEGQTLFTNECGCGCIDAVCPDPTDPKVHYIGDSHANPAECLPILFGCDEGQTLFTNDCGCGCIDP